MIIYIPVKPGKHLHCPLELSQIPLLEHSANLCAEPSANGRSAHAKPAGHAIYDSDDNDNYNDNYNYNNDNNNNNETSCRTVSSTI